MDRLGRLLSCVLLALLPLTAALKFDLHPVAAHDSAKYERCIRNFVAREQLVVVTAILDGYRGDGQRVDMHVRCNYQFQHIETRLQRASNTHVKRRRRRRSHTDKDKIRFATQWATITTAPRT
jgi:hypothetical protein